MAQQNVRPIDPLNHDVPIVDERGRPTPQFQRQWVQARMVNVATEEINVRVGGLTTSVGDMRAVIEQVRAELEELIEQSKVLLVGTRNGPVYTLEAGDATMYLRLSHPTDMLTYVPADEDVNFPVGTQIYVERTGIGTVQIIGAVGVDVRSEGNKYHLTGRWSVAALVKVGPNEWTLRGDRVNGEPVIISIPDPAELVISTGVPSYTDHVLMIITDPAALAVAPGIPSMPLSDVPAPAALTIATGVPSFRDSDYPQVLGSVVTTVNYADTVDEFHTVALPAGIEEGDLICIFATSQTAGTQFTPPAGWHHAYSFGRVSVQNQLITKVAVGTEGASIVLDSRVRRNAAYVAFRIARDTFVIQSHDPFDNVDIVALVVGADANGTTANPDAPNFAPLGGSARRLWFAVAHGRGQDGGVGPVDAPFTDSPWPDWQTTQTAVGSPDAATRVSIAVAWHKQEAAAVDPGAFTRVAARWTAMTVAIDGVL